MDDLEAQRRAPFGDNPKVGGRGQATHRAILEAAVEAFGEQGFHRTSVEAITERVGCSRATFYQYFDGKDDLLRRLAGRMGEELGRLLDDLAPIEANRAGRHLIRGWLVDLLDVYRRYRPVADTFLVAVRSDPELAAGSDRLAERYRDSLEAAIADPAPSPATGTTLAGMTAILAYGACHHREQTDAISRERLVDALADVIHRALFGPIEGANLSPVVARDAPPARGLPHRAVDTSALRPKGLRTRQRLVDAATTTFVRLGYDGTRVSDIADEAQLSHGAFYRYFDDKAAIFSEIANGAAADILAHIALLPDPPRGVFAWADEFVRAYEGHQRVFSVWPEAVAAGVEESDTPVLEVMATLADGFADRPFGDADADALICLALLDRVPWSTFAIGAFTVDEAIAGLATFVGRGLLGREL